MSPASVPPDTAAAVRGVLSSPLQTVLSALQDLRPPKHRRAPSGGPGGARFVGGAGHKPQRVVTLNHNCTVADALEKLARVRRDVQRRGDRANREGQVSELLDLEPRAAQLVARVDSVARACVRRGRRVARESRRMLASL